MHPSRLVCFYRSQQIQLSFICTFKDEIVTSFDNFPALYLQIIYEWIFLTLQVMFTLELTLLVKIMLNKLTQENTDVRRIHRIWSCPFSDDQIPQCCHHSLTALSTHTPLWLWSLSWMFCKTFPPQIHSAIRPTYLKNHL